MKKFLQELFPSKKQKEPILYALLQVYDLQLNNNRCSTSLALQVCDLMIHVLLLKISIASNKKLLKPTMCVLASESEPMAWG